MAAQPMAEHVVLQSATLARLPWMETAEVVSKFSESTSPPRFVWFVTH